MRYIGPSKKMGTTDAYAMILAGGGGTRLWPASRRKRPKQLLTLGGTESLLGATFRRTEAVFGRENILVVTAADQVEALQQVLPQLPPENLVAEPAARNTAAAVGLGAAVVARRAGPDAVLAVLPSDHHIGDEAAFATTLRLAIAQAREAIVTIGIRPTHPETGFGYIQQGASVATGVYEVARFVEKPDAARAAEYLAAGTYLWNSGMFFFTAGRLLAEARRHLPELGAALDALVTAADFPTALRALYPGVPAISIDYGIMEKTQGIRVIPGDFKWNDVGSWAALPNIRTADAAGNVVSGQTVLAESRGSIVLSEPGAPLVGVVGVENLVVIATADAILVVPKDRAQEVKRVVEALAAAKRQDLL
jgi:mannose-1-phosphate guanylyltransferase